MNLLPIGQTTQTSCPGCPNPLPYVSSFSPATPRFASIFFFFPKTATPPTQQHHEEPLMTDAALCLLPQTTKTQPLALKLLDHDLLPSSRHRTKDEDSRLRQW